MEHKNIFGELFSFEEILMKKKHKNPFPRIPSRYGIPVAIVKPAFRTSFSLTFQ
jgi:hypothetical protein